MVLPFTAITALPSMTPVRVYIQAVRRALRSSGCRFFSTGRLVGSLGRACPWIGHVLKDTGQGLV